MIRNELREILRCPENQATLTPADAALVAELNARIRAGQLLNKAGREVGEGLALFFEQWVDRAGAPNLRLAGVNSAANGAEYLVRGSILQEEPAFALSVPVVVEGGGGGRLAVHLAAAGPESGFELAVPFEPRRVSVDPDFELFRMLHPEEVPPALSGILGAPRTRIVIGSGTSGALREALVAAAREAMVVAFARLRVIDCRSPRVLANAATFTPRVSQSCFAAS